AMLPDGSRLHVVLPDITRTHPAVNIRKFIARPRSLANLVANGSLTSGAAEFLDAAVASGANILVSGATKPHPIPQRFMDRQQSAVIDRGRMKQMTGDHRRSLSLATVLRMLRRNLRSGAMNMSGTATCIG